MSDRSSRRSVGDRRNTPRFASAGASLTRFAPDQSRPASASQLTRFKQEHSRTPAEDLAPDPQPQRRHRVQATPAAPAPPAPAARPEPVPQPLPQTEVVQPTAPQTLRSTQAELYSDAPITISILKRALPRRFAQIEAGVTINFNNQPQQKNAQLGLTHAVRPLKSLFPYDPS